jgi:crotonobetainyl-CoA:carnitine CoA-transferase CaiB-like acyl-CoA transferase
MSDSVRNNGPERELNRPPGPLDGLLVADFARVLAGPYATMLLGDLGATVIKVESHGGDDTRNWRPPEHNGVSTYYLGVNRNKRSITLDLADPDDRAAAQELAARADVFIENFKPGGLRRFQLDYASVRQKSPRIIYCSISGFGSQGGGAALPGYDLVVQAMSGLMSLTGDPDGPAYRAGMSFFDIMAGLHATIGILAALQHRARTGEGQQIEVSLMASALSGMANHSSAYVAAGVVPFRMGNAHPSLFPYEALPTADQDLIIIAGNDGQFRRLCEVLGLPEVADDPRFGRAVERNRNRETLRPLLVDRLRTRSANDWFHALSEAGLACGPINTIDAGFRAAIELGLEPVVQVGTGDSALPMMRNPITFSASPARYDLPPPTLGQDNEVIRDWLRRPATPSSAAETASLWR